MPVLACCSSGGLAVLAVVTLLLLPAQYYVPPSVLPAERASTGISPAHGRREMPVWACCSSGGLAVLAVVTLLVLPAQYYVPPSVLPEEGAAAAAEAGGAEGALELLDITTLDLVLTASMLLFGAFIYLSEWIHRKLMERRIVKLNAYLGASLERLRALDEQQEQLESTLRMVQTGTSEYNLLLYLLLREHRRRAAAGAGPPSNCFFDKDADDDFHFLRSPTLDT